jgi:hypothetical protein
MNSTRIPPREAFLFTVIITSATALAITNKETVRDYYNLLSVVAGAVGGYLTSDSVQRQLARDLRNRSNSEEKIKSNSGIDE